MCGEGQSVSYVELTRYSLFLANIEGKLQGRG